MKIDTTINIRKEILDRIDQIAETSLVSRSRIVSLLLKRILREKAVASNRFSRVKYQKRDRNAAWKRPHVVLEYDLYEKSLDLRKLSKMSVSFILTVAYHRYLDKVMDDLRKGGESSSELRNYICIGRRFGKVFSFTVFWDFPPEEELVKFLE